MISKGFVTFGAVAIVLAIAGCQTPRETYTAQLLKALGKDVAGYQTFSLPTDNFGLATSYAPSSDSAIDSALDFVCST